MNTQYERFLSKENFLHAWRIVRNSDRLEVKDWLSIEILSAQTEAHIDILVQDIERNRYSPESPHFLYQAKRDKTLYPLTFLKIYDRLVYQAIGNVILAEAYHDLEPYLNVTIYGNAPQGPREGGQFGDFVFLPPFPKDRFRGQYGRFTSALLERREELLPQEDFHEIGADITSFYPSIDHRLLISELSKRGWVNDDQLKELLLFCLSRWSFSEAGQEIARGLPIGYEASDLLANLFLFFLDEKYQPYSLMRYVDDLFLFVDGGNDRAIGVLGDLKLELQKRGLYVNDAKTDIRSITEAYENNILNISLPTARENLSGHSDVSEEDFFQIYSDFDNPCNLEIIGNYGTDLAFILYRLQPKNSFIRDVAICMLTESPKWSIQVTRYLSQFSLDERVISSLFDVVENGNILTSVRLDSAAALVTIFGEPAPQLKGIIEDWLMNGSDWYLRFKGLEIISPVASFEFVQRIWQNDPNIFVKCRAIRIGFDLASSQEQNIVVINQALGEGDRTLHALAIYLWRRDVTIKRAQLNLKQMRRFKKLYLSDEQQKSEKYFLSDFYFLFDLKLNNELPIHEIFPNEEINPAQLLLDARDAGNKPEAYIKAIYDFVFHVLSFIANQNDPYGVAYIVGDLEARLDDTSTANVALLRILRYRVEKNERIDRKDFLELKQQLRKLFAINFMKIHHHFQLEVDLSLKQAYEEALGMRDKVFISYAREDKDWRDKIRKALIPKFQGTGFIWSDNDLKPGDKWGPEIEQKLDRTKIAILLVSMNFAASKYIKEVELPAILAADEKKELTVVWLAVGYSDYESLSHIHCVNDPEQPLESLPPSEVNRILVKAAEFVYRRYHNLE